MKNKIRGILLPFICLVGICLLSISAYADGPLDGQIVGGSLLISELQAEDTRALVVEGASEYDITPYGTYLSYGTVGIANLGSGQVNFYGDTVCNKVSDIVKVNLHLQQLKNGVWSDYTTRYCTEYNDSLATSGYYTYVPTGYYYRVKGVHSATKGSVVESMTTYTKGVFIS
ncbi:MAG: DUF6147 family protein [Eubacteriales bacterium]|nr:DUF6147 family protein [Eubacteriales bacterium]